MKFAKLMERVYDCVLRNRKLETDVAAQDASILVLESSVTEKDAYIVLMEVENQELKVSNTSLNEQLVAASSDVDSYALSVSELQEQVDALTLERDTMIEQLVNALDGTLQEVPEIEVQLIVMPENNNQ